jgi:hypothetical protein
MGPTNEEITQGLYKKNLREGEERFMLALLESAVEDFQEYVLARNPGGKKLFQQAEEWFLDKDSEGLFPFGVSARPSSCIPTKYGRACSSPGPTSRSPEVSEEPCRALLGQALQDGINSFHAATATRAYIQSAKSSADCIPGPSLCRLHIGHWSQCGTRIVLAGRLGASSGSGSLIGSCAIIGLLGRIRAES